MKQILAGMAELVWPPVCAACDARVDPALIFCLVCAETLVETRGASERLSFLRPPAWRFASCRFEFGGQLAVAVRRMKYGGDGARARALGRLLPCSRARVELVVPVPLHPRRLARRGFDQAAELARGRGLRPTFGLLVRVRDTPTQTDLPPAARLANVTGAFAVRRHDKVRGRTVLLVDDVITTGATADACTLALLRAGAEAVHVIALARAQPV